MNTDSSVPFALGVGRYFFRVSQGDPRTVLPRGGAAIHDEIGISPQSNHSSTTVLVLEDGGGRPLLSIVGRDLLGFSQFGACLVPETQRLFVGSGDMVRCFALDDPPRALWSDSADTGFADVKQWGDVVLMGAELEFAAWTTDGVKLWSTFVEPPWTWRPCANGIELEVMGVTARFDVKDGPPAGPPAFWLATPVTGDRG